MGKDFGLDRRFLKRCPWPTDKDAEVLLSLLTFIHRRVDKPTMLPMSERLVLWR